MSNAARILTSPWRRHPAGRVCVEKNPANYHEYIDLRQSRYNALFEFREEFGWDWSEDEEA